MTFVYIFAVIGVLTTAYLVYGLVSWLRGSVP